MRYLPLDASEREAMLTRIGVPNVDALFADIPPYKRTEGLLDLPLAKSERLNGRAPRCRLGRRAVRCDSAVATASRRKRVRTTLPAPNVPKGTPSE